MIIVIAVIVICVIIMLRKKKKEGFDAHSSVGTAYVTNWCGFSKKMLAGVLPHNVKNNIVKVGNYKLKLLECSKNKELCKKQNISGFPTTILSNNEQIVGYTPDFEKAIKEGLEKPQETVEQTTPPVMEGFDGHDGVIYYADWCGFSKKLIEDLYKHNEITSDKIKTGKYTLNLVECTDNKACEGKGIDGFPTIILNNGQKVVGYTPRLNEAIERALKKKPEEEKPVKEEKPEPVKEEKPKKEIDNFFGKLFDK